MPDIHPPRGYITAKHRARGAEEMEEQPASPEDLETEEATHNLAGESGFA